MWRLPLHSHHEISMPHVTFIRTAKWCSSSRDISNFQVDSKILLTIVLALLMGPHLLTPNRMRHVIVLSLKTKLSFRRISVLRLPKIATFPLPVCLFLVISIFHVIPQHEIAEAYKQADLDIAIWCFLAKSSEIAYQEFSASTPISWKRLLIRSMNTRIWILR